MLTSWKRLRDFLFLSFQYLVPQQLLSRGIGFIADSKLFAKPFIRWFVQRYSVDMEESLKTLDSFSTFNDFFTRALKPSARPFDNGHGVVLCPADGSLSQFGNIDQTRLVQAKGRSYEVSSLLGGDAGLSTSFKSGVFATIYLSPKDYHRVHMPLAGRLIRTAYIPGNLFSVNQVTANAVQNLYARNERLVCLFETEVGLMAIVLVGAMVVAGIDTVWSGRTRSSWRSKLVVKDYSCHQPDIFLKAGAEMGRFRLGSTVILLFPPGLIELDNQLVLDKDVRMGQAFGRELKDHLRES